MKQLETDFKIFWVS